MQVLFYFLLEFIGIGLFVMLGVCGIYGSIGFLISLVALALITYSTYNLFKKNMPFRAFINLIIASFGGPINSSYSDEKLKPKYKKNKK